MLTLLVHSGILCSIDYAEPIEGDGLVFALRLAVASLIQLAATTLPIRLHPPVGVGEAKRGRRTSGFRWDVCGEGIRTAGKMKHAGRRPR
jgi:hypothetical protein